jgi:hypothetical protein
LLDELRAVDEKTQRQRWSIADIPSVWSLDARLTWLVPDILPEGAITMLTGDSGVGKSTLALALCGSVVRGMRFLGRDSSPRRALYIDRENPLSVVRERLERLRIGETPELIVWGGWVDPAPDGPAMASVMRFARDERPLIVFDSFIAFHPGSEQDASETRRYMQHYRNLASVGATVLVIHHTGKSENAREYRGSSDIKAAVDIAWLLESMTDPRAGLKSLRLTSYKNRITFAEPIRIECEENGFRVGDRVETNREIIERIVSGHAGTNQAALVRMAQSAGVPKHRAQQLLSDGARDGWLIVEIGPRGAKMYKRGKIES